MDSNESAPSGPVGPVRGILHVNSNTTDLAANRAFYGDVLGLSVGMTVPRAWLDGTIFDFPGETYTETLFWYDQRGPRVAPAVEIIDWEDPPTTPHYPQEPNHLGLAAIGYAVPDLEAFLTGPAAGQTVSGRVQAGEGRPTAAPSAWLRDPDGVPVEIVEHPEAGPGATFSHIRLNCSDLDTAIAWYGVIGFDAVHVRRDVTVPAALVGLPADGRVSAASLTLPDAPGLSIELTQWHEPASVGETLRTANSRGLFRIALAVDSIAEAVAVTEAAWGPQRPPTWVALPGTKLGGVTVEFLADPDGLVVELVERPTRHRRPRE
jgi:catechol 2,3-dioxygenase-like lactoylglutathione lyase family enzyme